MIHNLRPILPLLAIGILLALQLLVNNKKTRRIRQLPLVILAGLLMLAGLLLWVKLEGFAEYLVLLAPDLADGEIALMNLLLMAAFLVLKQIFRPTFLLIFRKKNAAELLALGIYEYDDQYDQWFLKKQWARFRSYVLGIVVALALICAVFLGLTWVLGPDSVLWVRLLPCAVLVIAAELYCYLSGITKEEYMHSVLGDASDARRVGNYYKLREVYEKLLPEPILSAHTGSEYMRRESCVDLLKKLEQSDSSSDRITAEYFRLNDRFKKADADCVQATAALMSRRNVVFFNPFYRDMGLYLTLPLVRVLLSGKKVTVLCGKKNIADDLIRWLDGLLSDYSHMHAMWRVAALTDLVSDCDVGVLTFTQIYDKQVILENREFLQDTDLLILVEPSAMLTTGQVALSILSDEMSLKGDKPSVCVFDRYTDGLVDTLSHLLRAEITDVVAPPVPRCHYTAITWDSDGDYCRQELFDRQTRYLGNGMELAAIAVKNQIPRVTWYSESKAPIRDIRWIAGQHYSTICRYMNQPSQQKSIDEKIRFVANLWSTPQEDDQFSIVEDEFCNMFSTLRAFLSRSEKHSFVNVLSEDYLLRDYMRCNRQLFLSNPNAVPSLVPDYAKTERNTILKLILAMTLKPISEEEVENELQTAGIQTENVLGTLVELLHKYTYAQDNIFSVRTARSMADEFTVTLSNVYSVVEEEFERYFADSLKNAYFLLEEEKNEQSYIDAKIFSQVTQIILPGQFVCYDGKYYQAKYVSPQSGVVLRRASDLYDGRKYYRQIRRYDFDFSTVSEPVSLRRIMDIEFAEIRTDFSVLTSGYLEMRDNSDLRSARLVDFSDDPTLNNYLRRYRSKSVLRIRLPDADEKLCFTLSLLLGELFRTVFPNGWPYLAVLTKRDKDLDGMLRHLVYEANGDLEDGCLYIVEDCDLDLGLMDAVERNFMRFMEILSDYLDWHFEKMREPPTKDPVPPKVAAAEAAETRRRGLVSRLLDRIRKLFGGKKEPVEQIGSAESVEEQAEREAAQAAPAPEAPAQDVPAEADYQPGETPAEEAEAVAPIDAAENSEPAEVPADEPGEEPEEEPSRNYPAETDTEDTSETEEEPAENEAGDEPGTEDAGAPRTADAEEEASGEEASDPEPEQEEEDPELESEEDSDLVHVDGTDIFEGDGEPEDNEYLEMSFQALGIAPITKTRYQRECFLKFGFEEISERIRLEELLRYLRLRGWSSNALNLARKKGGFFTGSLDLDAVNTCDFCGLPLTGVCHDKLSDGRVRCNDCSSTAITTVEEMRELFFDNLKMMEDLYEIQFKVPVNVRMADAKEVGKRSGMIFKPSKEFSARVLGFAQHKRGKYSVVLENGSPRLATINTTVHEMTHIWQYLNWSDKAFAQYFGMGHSHCTELARLIVYEGMAMWSSIQYLYQIGETYFASQQEALAEARQDVYGVGFRFFREQYPFVKDASLLKYTPFTTFPPIDPEPVKAVVRASCTRKKCRC